ncbi:hypothetical protein MAR_023596 [Mya arenaria]|uniref:SRCR domain-containing protein n=1 Tax=Mya arenaria TaxID=6604 RepID=A0ABY7DT02_MYAAR|nr:hypothetical protein MAR_023596 [Mya arenaria]
MGDLHCDGSEEDLLFCKSGPWRAHSCPLYTNALWIECNISHTDVFNHTCTDTPVYNTTIADYALGGNGSYEGLCDSGFGPIYANCIGYETDISQCNLYQADCHYTAGVDCSAWILILAEYCFGAFNRTGYCSSGYAAAVDCNTVRLVGGTNYTNGRVEVYDTFNQTWENVCYDHFSYNDAKVPIV